MVENGKTLSLLRLLYLKPIQKSIALRYLSEITAISGFIVIYIHSNIHVFH